MYDINLKNVKKSKNFFRIFLIGGLLFVLILGGIVVSTILKSFSMDSEVMSVSVDIDSYVDDDGEMMYSPIYTYVVNDERYTCKANSYSSSKPSDKNAMVKYNSKDPSSCMTSTDNKTVLFFALFLFIPVIFIIVGIKGIGRVNKRVATINELNIKGKLVKGLPYTLERTNIEVNGTPLMKIAINYTLSTGETVKLYGEPIHDGKTSDADGAVDLLIDEANPSNYFIDFEINRLSGNTSSDYYRDASGNTYKSTLVNNQPVVDQNGQYVPQPIEFDQSVNTYKGPNS